MGPAYFFKNNTKTKVNGCSKKEKRIKPLDLMYDDIRIVLLGYQYPEKKYLVINTQTASLYIRIKPYTPTVQKEKFYNPLTEENLYWLHAWYSFTQTNNLQEI
jgi:hypothetical protein